MAQDATVQQLALRLFLDDRSAFDYAWSRYLLYGGHPRLSRYPLLIESSGLNSVSTTYIERRLSDYFGKQAKGNCHVEIFEDADEIIVRIVRGSYLRNVAFWQGNEVTLHKLRPAADDVLVYNPSERVASIKAAKRGDQFEYLKAFCATVAADEAPAWDAFDSELYSLEPGAKWHLQLRG